jgi:nucleoside-diphosphate-sugar epimerase
MEVNRKKPRIFITGANGFVGSFVLERLYKKNAFKIGIVLRTKSDTWRIKSIIAENKINVFNLDEHSIQEIIAKFRPNVVINLAAAYAHSKYSQEDIDNMIYSNITFPTKMLEAMVQNGIKYFINTGTWGEYLISKENITSDSEVSPSSLYAATKSSFESILKFYIGRNKIKGITLRLLTVYGPKDNPNSFIPYVINCGIRGEKANVTSGEQFRDYVYVKDVAKAYELAVGYLLGGREGYSSFLIGSGEAHSLREIGEILKGLNPKLKINWGYKPYNDGEIFYVRADITQSRNLLKWRPDFNLREGLFETYKYYVEGGK